MLLSYSVTDVKSHYLQSIWQMLLPFYDNWQMLLPICGKW